jgi:YD repeat-containing protein
MENVLKSITFLIAVLVLPLVLLSQITVPVNYKELADYKRESDAMKFMKIDLSQTWLFMVKDNIISSNKILVQEVYYNSEGLPERILHYDEMQKLKTYTVIKYNNHKLPFEEIDFTADSVLISGILFEYDDNDLLSRQVDYDNKAELIAMQTYQRSNDSIMISVTDKAGNLIYKNLIILSGKIGKEQIKSMTKSDRNNTVFEKVMFEYDELQSLSRKFVYDDKNIGTRREFVYNDEGALIRTVTYDENSAIHSDSSFEYDNYGNVIRIIDLDSSTGSTKVYFVKYLAKVAGNE